MDDIYGEGGTRRGFHGTRMRGEGQRQGMAWVGASADVGI